MVAGKPMFGLEKKMGHLLADRDLTLAVAESCTGGMLGHRITSVGGSSVYFLGGIIAYSNKVKMLVLGVDHATLRKEGAVSEQVARQMALSVRGRFGADIGVGVTGIAGPGGGSEEKPVGLVYIGLAYGRKCIVKKFNFPGKQRNKVKELSCQSALKMVIDFLEA